MASPALTTTCARCDLPLEVAEDASFVRCPACGAVDVVETAPPWALADASSGSVAIPTPQPGFGASSRPPPPPRRSQWPPAETTTGTQARAPLETRSAPPPPVQPFTDELVTIRCVRCELAFDGPIGHLHCPRCGAQHAVDSAAPWEIDAVEDLP